MASEPSKNGPCPCGSGKKYKRCCLGMQSTRGGPSAERSRSTDERLVEQTELQLIATKDLPAELEWSEFDFGVDLFDPVLDDLSDLFLDMNGKPSEDDLVGQLAKGLFIHGTAEVRARCEEELEQRLQKSHRRRTFESGHLALAALGDPELAPPQIGILLDLYYRYMLRRVLERVEILSAEEKRLDPSLVREARDAARAGTPSAFYGLATKLLPLGPDALPYIEYAVSMEDLDEAIRPLVEISEKHPSVRSARILGIMLDAAATNSAIEIISAALCRMPSFAWPILIYRVRDHDRAPWERIVAAELLVRARVWEVYEPLISELWRSQEDDWDDEFYTDIAELLAKLGDRRAVGCVLRQIHEGSVPDVAVAALKETWATNGWWTEVEEGLDALKIGKRILVESGEQFTELVEKEIVAAPLTALESAQFRTSMVQEDWNNAYHEDLDWLRPTDLAGMGPAEAKLMQEFATLAQKKCEGLREHLEGKDAVDWLARIQDEWSTTPQPGLGGCAPLAVILAEKRRLAESTGYCEKYIRRKLAELCSEGRQALASNDRERAKRYLAVVLNTDPEHPFAQRLLKQVER